MSTIIKIKLNKQEKQLLNNMAMLKGISVSKMIKQFIYEKFEDKHYYNIVKEYKKEKEEGTIKLMPFDELLKE